MSGPVPTVGRIVHFLDGNTWLPAIVVYRHPTDGSLDLVSFGGSFKNGHTAPHLVACGHLNVREGLTDGCWCWPPREEHPSPPDPEPRPSTRWMAVAARVAGVLMIVSACAGFLISTWHASVDNRAAKALEAISQLAQKGCP